MTRESFLKESIQQGVFGTEFLAKLYHKLQHLKYQKPLSKLLNFVQNN